MDKNRSGMAGMFISCQIANQNFCKRCHNIRMSFVRDPEGKGHKK